nr:hypothetical protein [uncultured Pseudomonas sp.]
MRLMVYPAAFMTNTFAMMVVMIGLSVFGKSTLAADFGLIHGATVALFYSFSGNARSLILSESGVIDAPGILRLRMILLLPLGVVAWLLCAGLVSASWIFVLLLVVRRAAEWIAEIFISEQELRHQEQAAIRFLLTQSILSPALLLALLNDGPFPIPTTLIWALSPLLGCMSVGLLKRALNNRTPLLATIRLMLPHFGSTAVIGMSVYVFRLFILLVVDKQVAGDLFSAFALGGILGAVFSQALGPTMVRYERLGSGVGRMVTFFNKILILMLLVGVTLVICTSNMPYLLDWTRKDQLFWLAVGYSLIGGGVMVMAQRIRLRILQDKVGGDVFGSDMLSNIFLISSIPFLFYGVGVSALAFLYLLGALLSWIFYASERHGLLSLNASGWLTQKKMLLGIAVMIFMPIFFQLQGTIFNDPTTNFSSGGVLSLLPIPFSVLACYSGMVLLGRYSQARLSLLSLFFVFVGMLLTSLLLGLDANGAGKQKLILLIQYLLPMFALVLGQQYGTQDGALTLVAKSALFVLLIILPIQLFATVSIGEVLLSPYVYFFSIYQNLQYASQLFVAAFVLVLFTLSAGGYDRRLQLLAFLTGAYVVLSWSLLAIFIFSLGVLLFVLQQRAQGRRIASFFFLLGAAISGVLAAIIYVYCLKHSGVWTLFPDGANYSMRALEGHVGYMERWLFYVDGITASWADMLLGHVASPARELFPSALNYYLDFAYNFGLIGLLPLIWLAFYTFMQVGRQWRKFWEVSAYMGLMVIVVFMLLIDSSLKVGLRQPYSGVIMFFLWGMLLATLKSNARSSSIYYKEI